MTKEEILTKAAEKAIANGFKPSEFAPDTDPHSYRVCTPQEAIGHGEVEFIGYIPDSPGHEFHTTFFAWQVLVYNHDFAKALWGEEIIETGEPGGGLYGGRMPMWKSNLQDMVVTDNPIAYLGEYL